jgi:hypothetical protein
MFVIKRITFCALLFSVSIAAIAEKTTTASRADKPPIIDGKLDDVAWAGAVVVDDFHEITPQEFDPASEHTEILLLYDADNLYIGMRAFESDPQDISAKTLRQNSSLRNDDRIKIVLSPFNDGRSGYGFFLNPLGARSDVIYKDNTFDSNWTGIWHGESSINNDGWTAEIAIPFKTLSFVGGADWGINFGRAVERKQEEMGWESRNRVMNPSIVGTLTGLTDLSQGVGLDMVPSVSVTSSRDFDPRSDTTNAEPSLDVYYKLTPSLNASLTLNTDFSATEVDNRQVNLTRFDLFFPEKRGFFLRESDIFEFGGITGNFQSESFSRADSESGRPYFSRRIGLSSSGQPVDLDVGAKISGRIGRWNIGAQAIRQAEFEDVDASNILVSRISANILEESTAGFIVTNGDPRSNLDNTLLGFDFLYRNSQLEGGRQMKVDLWYQQSDTEGFNGDDAAFGIRLDMPNQTAWRGGAALKEIQENFNPAVGFISRSGIRQTSADIGYTFRPNGPRVRSVSMSLAGQRIDLIDGELQSQIVFLRPFDIRNNGNDRLAVGYTSEKQNLLSPFEISDDIFIPPGNYSFDSTEVTLESGQHRLFSSGIKYEFGDFYDGDLRATRTQIAWRPSKHFQMSATFTISEVDLPQGDFTTRLASAAIETVFSNTLSWVNLIQYDNISESVGLNSRLHWTPQAGRNVFLVLNHNYRRCVVAVGDDCMGDTSFQSTRTDLTLKADYTFRF